MVISYPTDENILRAAYILREGGIVAFPTETVYGLGGDALNPMAVSRIFEAKQRPFFDPLIVHINSLDWAERLSGPMTPVCEKLMEHFWPGPLTIVVRKSSLVPDIVTSGLDTVALRMPAHTVAQGIISAVNGPLAAPSANPFGYISPTRAEHVLKQLGDRVDMIIEGGDCAVGVESTIVRINDDQSLTLLRHGGISLEDIQNVAGPVVAGSRGSTVEAPGQLPYHYSPATPVRLVKNFKGIDLDDVTTGFIYYKKPRENFFANERFVALSDDGDLRESASRLFTLMHQLDGLGLDLIYAEEVPEEGLGKAIMDRLRKAAGRTQHD